VEQRLAAYTPLETDPLVVAEMERILRSGMKSPRPLPAIPGQPASAASGEGRRPRRFRR
jgi:hypothetical protein